MECEQPIERHDSKATFRVFPRNCDRLARPTAVISRRDQRNSQNIGESFNDDPLASFCLFVFLYLFLSVYLYLYLSVSLKRLSNDLRTRRYIYFFSKDTTPTLTFAVRVRCPFKVNINVLKHSDVTTKIKT